MGKHVCDNREAVHEYEAIVADVIALVHAARDLLANRVPIPDKGSDYVPRVFIMNLRDAVEKVTGEKVNPC
jgi:hypothetical protein